MIHRLDTTLKEIGISKDLDWQVEYRNIDLQFISNKPWLAGWLALDPKQSRHVCKLLAIDSPIDTVHFGK